jgi:hypothetical protein
LVERGLLNFLRRRAAFVFERARSSAVGRRFRSNGVFKGGCDAEDGPVFAVSFVCATGFNAERVDGVAVLSGGVPGIGVASRTIVVPSGDATAFGATRRGETGVGPACVGGTAFLGTCSFAIICDVPLKTFGARTACGVPLVVCVGTVANVRPDRRAPNGRVPGLFGVCRVQTFS